MTILHLIEKGLIVSPKHVRSGQGNASPDLVAPQASLTGRAYRNLWSYMSIKITAAVWLLTLPMSEKMVLLALADHAKDDGFCWPGIVKLAKKCCLSERQLQRNIKSLERRGLLKLTYRHGRSTYFKLLVTPMSPSENGVTSTSPAGDTHVTTNGDIHVTQKRNLNHKEPLDRKNITEWKKSMGIYVL